MNTVGDEHHGGCFCGAIRFRVTGAPLATTACHCRDCQRFSGAPFLPGGTFRARQFSLLSGKLCTFAYGVGRHRSFCPRCGSHLTYSRDDQPGFVEVFTVCLDDPDMFPPQEHTWFQRKLGWVALADDLPRHATEPGDDNLS